MSSMYILLCVGWLGFAAALSAAPYALEDAEIHFEHFIKQYGKEYADDHEKQARLEIFKSNLEEINRMNKKSTDAVFGITQFSDLTLEEFHKYYSCLGKSGKSDACSYISEAEINYGDAPESFDWRERGAVTPVKDQDGCQGCYAFSAVGNIEGQYAIKNGQLLPLSEQQIIDCDTKNSGCNGGLMSQAFRSIIGMGGIEGGSDYPFEKRQGNCRFDASKVKVTLADCHSYNLTSQEKVKQLLYQNGPLSIGIQGDGIRQLLRGIISDDSCNVGNLNHAVLLVGYGSENGQQYWIAKNSWNSAWGEQGYFRFQRGEGALSCGMMNDDMSSSVVA